ncbi:hypothetical protein DPMN_024337 [Dreissena polymorpha]|uniref:Uncharacterized protein n=1 Tax=Dreissena polymorpha TaxID=45954 RepID=A0A9D4LP61_DREPO|nr:hypothetical protein DPMN_024337 [Dreissena polymorpha]
MSAVYIKLCKSADGSNIENSLSLTFTSQDTGIQINLEECYKYVINESHSLQLGTDALENSLQLGSEALDAYQPKANISKITSIVDAATQTTFTGPIQLNSGHIYIHNFVESCTCEKSTLTFIQVPVLGK